VPKFPQERIAVVLLAVEAAGEAGVPAGSEVAFGVEGGEGGVEAVDDWSE
jgi:hypothetical protein